MQFKIFCELQDLRDLVRKLEEYESRKTISVIVVNSSSDRFFCDGLDYKVRSKC